ncbi:hypothetical protein [uncultured Alsobacter sp.]|uniref:hypothetical protein n=1 Tax=uncultured Alsobacter sp. TaxID=1748258 RepID=UPI0025CE532F|nr:hypothetical protein [uncultured Alsobacter sp.]
MTPEDLAETTRELRLLSTNVIGFHALMEDADEYRIAVVRRIMNEAHFVASAVRMAVLVDRLAEHLSDEGKDGDG